MSMSPILWASSFTGSQPDIYCREKIRSLNLDEKTVAERIFFEDLKARIDELSACLPQVEVRESYLDPGSVLDSVAATVQRQLSVKRAEPRIAGLSQFGQRFGQAVLQRVKRAGHFIADAPIARIHPAGHLVKTLHEINLKLRLSIEIRLQFRKNKRRQRLAQPAPDAPDDARCRRRSKGC